MAVPAPVSGRFPYVRWGRWGAGVVMLVLVVAAFGYLLTPYAALRDWYLGLTPNLYRAAAWPRDFFIPAVKAQGNWFCVSGLAVLTLLGLGWVVSRWGPVFLHAEDPSSHLLTRPAPGLVQADLPYLIGLLLVASGLWTWGVVRLPPAYDEVFSAVYSAGNGSAFVAWSYYMLPNNHLLFNVLNNILFSWWVPPTALVLSGRLLSGVAYVATVGVIYRTLAGLLRQRPLAAGLALLAALQYSLWGFGSQARGYALYGLMHWLAIAMLLNYWQQPTPARRWGNAVAVAVGYATVPTFLFHHVAQLLAAVSVQVRRRQLDGQFWWAQANALGAVYWFYLPALCFSGLKALSANPYVRPHHGPVLAFVAGAWPRFREYASYCFGTAGLSSGVGYALALLPLVLLGWPRPAGVPARAWPWRRLALLYALWLLVLAAGTLALQLLVFSRNLLGLFSLMLVLALLALGLLLSRWQRWAGISAPLVLALWLGGRFVRSNPVQDPGKLYGSKVLVDYQLGLKRIAKLPRVGTRAFSEESFYPYFLSRQAGRLAPHPAHRPVVAADYFITAPNDHLPVNLAATYVLIDTVGGYRLYRHRAGSPRP